MRLARSVPIVAAALAAIISVSACGGGTTSASGDGNGTGTLQAGDKKEIVYFSFGTNNVYAQGNEKAMKEVAEKYGYHITTIDANLSQATADQNVRQYIASGKKPAGFLWQPPNAAASDLSTKLLSQVAPVVQVTFTPPNEDAKVYTATNQEATGSAAAKVAEAAREAAKKAGMQLHSPNGNLLWLDYFKGESITEDRDRGFNNTLETPFNVVAHEYGTNDPDNGYTVANTILPKVKSAGIDFIYAFNLQSATGVVRAAEQNGLTPGKDVIIFAGDCSGSVQDIRNGKVFGTVIQPAQVEGRLAVRTLLQYIATGKTSDETVTLPATADEPELTVTPPAKVTYMEEPPMIGAQGLDKKYWGLTYAETCS